MTNKLKSRIQVGGERIGQPYMMSLPPLPACADALPLALRNSAQQYLSVRRQSGDALLAAVKLLSDARKLAVQGEWGVYLEAIGLDEGRARAQIRLHEEAESNPQFAEYLRSGWLTEAVARELLPAPAEVQQEVLSRGKAPTLKDVRETKRALTPVLPPAQKPKISEVATRHDYDPITIQTKQGPHLVTPLRTNGVLALHEAVDDASGFTLTHIASGRKIAQFAQRFSADRAFDQLEALDWGSVAPDSGMPAAFGLQVASILIQFDDVDAIDRRRLAHERLTARVALEERGWAFVPAEQPEGWTKLTHPDLGYGRQEPTIEAAIKVAGELQANYDRRDQIQAVEAAQKETVPAAAPPLIHPATCTRCGKESTEITYYQAGLVPEYPGRAVILCSRCIPELLHDRAELARLDQELPKDLSDAGYYWASASPLTIANNDGWKADAQTVEQALTLAFSRMTAPRPDPRAQIAALLAQIAPLMAGLTTHDQIGLSQAIADLNECQEGTEVTHWLKVGYALLDLES